MSSEYESNRGDSEDEDFDDTEEEEEESLNEDSDADDSDDDDDDDEDTDSSSRIRVDEFFAKMDSSDPNEIAHRREVRRRLEEIAERRNEDLDSTFNFNLDDD